MAVDVQSDKIQAAVAAGKNDRYLKKKYGLTSDQVASARGPETPASSGGASSGERKESTFKKTKDMEEIGVVSAGLTGSVGSVKPTKEGAVVLYDDATGTLYQTTEWHAVDKNRNYLVGPDGKRQRVAGYASSSDGGETFKLKDSAKPGSQWVVAGYNESLPEPGTEQFTQHLKDKFMDTARAQATQNRFSVDDAGKLVSPGSTDLGQYGSISAADYIRLGKPKRVGNLNLKSYRGKSDEEILAEGVLVGMDDKDRSHGIEKGLNKLGKATGLGSNLGKNLMRIASDIASVPVLGSGLALVVDPINAYEASRDMGLSSSAAMKEASKAGLVAVNNLYVDAAAAALTIASVAAAPFTGGASLAVGVAAGTAIGAAGAALKSGVQSTVYGGFDEGDFWNNVGTGAATGAVSGAVQGVARASTLSGASAGWQTAGKVVDSAWTQGALNVGQSYAVAYSKGGAIRDQADKIAFRSAVGGAASAMVGNSSLGKKLGWSTKPVTDSYKNVFMNEAMAGKSPLSRVGAAFREQAGTSGGILGAFHGRGSDSGEWRRDWSGLMRSDKNKVLPFETQLEALRDDGKLPAWYTPAALSHLDQLMYSRYRAPEAM
jgi:hypothetical protein